MAERQRGQRPMTGGIAPTGNTRQRGQNPQRREETPQYGVTHGQLEEALRASLQKGDRDLARAIASKMKNKEYDEELHDLQSFGLGASQGVTFGFGDEIYSGARAGIDWLTDDKEFGEAYDERLAANRKLLETARREDPWATGLGEVAGGAAFGGAGMARAAAGRGVLSAMGRGGLAGAGMGGVAGYGYSEADPLMTKLTGGSDEEVAAQMREAGGDAAIAATLGGGLGTLVPGAAGAVKSAARGLSRPFTKQLRIDEANRRLIEDSVRTDLATSGQTWDDVMKKMADDPDMVIADIGPQTRRLAEDIMQSGTQAGTKLREFARTRNQAAWNRTYPRIKEALTADPNKPLKEAEAEVLTRAKDVAQEFYKNAYDQPTYITPAMRNILQAKDFRAITKDAQKLYQAALIEQGVDAKAIKKIKLDSPVIDTQQADFIIRAMDQKVNKMFKGGESQMGYALKPLRDQFRQAVYGQNPDLARARSSWAGMREVEEAIERGEKLFREDFEGLAEIVAEMGGGERTGFRIGVARALVNRMGNKPIDADLTKGIFNAPNKRAAVQAAFADAGDPTGEVNFNKFMKYITSEQEKFELARLAGGSDTARRIKLTQDIGEQIAALGGYTMGLTAAGGVPPAIAGHLAKRAYGATRDALGFTMPLEQQMTSRGGMLMQPSIEALSKPYTMGGLLSPGVPKAPTALGGAMIPTGILSSDETYGGY